MAVSSMTARQALLAAAGLAEAEQGDSVNHQNAFKLRRRFNPPGPVPGTGVAKLVQYDVVLPPDNAVDVGKVVQYDVLVPPDGALAKAGFTRHRRESHEWGLLKSEWWRRIS